MSSGSFSRASALAAFKGWMRSSSATCLSDRDRRPVEARKQVQRAVARIYNGMLFEPTTEFVWIIEDDVIPPTDASKRLLDGFDKHVASVALPARSPYHEGYIAWDERNCLIEQPGRGLQTVGGNGFCCVMLRRSILRHTRFTHLGRNGDFDAAFYDWLAGTKYQVRMDWSVECEHLIETRVHPQSSLQTVEQAVAH